MTDIQPTQPSSNDIEKPTFGFVRKAFVGLGSIASGLGAGILYVNKTLLGNVSHSLLATADSQLEAAMTYLGNVSKNVVPGLKEEPVQQLLNSLPAPKPNEQAFQLQQAVRSDLRNTDTVLGQAFHSASNTHNGEKALQKINFRRIAQQNYWGFAQQHSEAERKANALIHQEYTNRRLAYDVGTVIDLEARGTLAKETVKHVPWFKKVTLSGIQLTKGQRIGAGVVFAAVTSVAALGLYKVLHRCRDKQEFESPQR